MLLPLLAGLPVGSARISHQLNELRYEERAAAFPTEHVTNFDHLFDHLSMGVHGVPCGSIELRKSRNRLSTGVHEGAWGPKDAYMS